MYCINLYTPSPLGLIIVDISITLKCDFFKDESKIRTCVVSQHAKKSLVTKMLLITYKYLELDKQYFEFFSRGKTAELPRAPVGSIKNIH